MATAGDQADLSDAFSAIRAKLRMAYTPAQPVTNRRMYSGRGRVLGSVIRAIEDQRLHTVIYGERGLGKTSTLLVLAQTARDARYLVIYVTCSAGSTFDEAFRAIAAGIPLMFHADYGPTSPQAERRETFATLLGDEPVGIRGAGELLAKVEGTRVLVIFDEFDRAESENFRRTIAELIKSLSDRAARVQILIGGVAANLTELVANVPSIQRNIYALQLPKMTASEIRELVKNGESVSGLSFDDSAIQAISAKALGFPYLATLLSHRSALVAIDRGRVTITAEDVADATGEVVDEFRGRISRRSQALIDECVAKGMLPALGALGGAAQTMGGWFTAADLHPIHGASGVLADARKVVDRLAEQLILIEGRKDEFGKSFHFIEESVPPYIWLLAAYETQAHATDHESLPASATA
jgi:histone H3/H4